jgi:hypothetical protein
MGYLLIMLAVLAASTAAGDVLGMHSVDGPGGMDRERLEADNMMMINGIAAMAFGLVMVL